MTPKTQVFLADDHVVVRDGVKALINAQPDMRVVGEAGDGVTTVDFCAAVKPDVVVLDISMPGMSAVEVTRRLLHVCPQSKILVLTVHECTAYMTQMLGEGVHGYVVKRSAGDDLIHGIRSVANGGTYIDPRVAEKLAGGLRAQSKEREGLLGVVLSERETDVLKMIAQGYSGKEIARTLNISQKSVDTYKARAMQKLNLDSRVDVVRYAMCQGWLV